MPIPTLQCCRPRDTTDINNESLFAVVKSQRQEKEQPVGNIAKPAFNVIVLHPDEALPHLNPYPFDMVCCHFDDNLVGAEVVLDKQLADDGEVLMLVSQIKIRHPFIDENIGAWHDVLANGEDSNFGMTVLHGKCERHL